MLPGAPKPRDLPGPGCPRGLRQDRMGRPPHRARTDVPPTSRIGRPPEAGATTAPPLSGTGPASPRLLDSLRGLAALAVVFTHVLSMAPPLEPALIRLLDATPLRAVHTGRAPVVFFFVLSGYVLALSLLRAGGGGLL